MTPGGDALPNRALPPLQPRWSDPSRPDAGVVEALTRELKLPPGICAVLAARGFHDVEMAKGFLRPLLDQLHDAALLADGEAAARRIARAVRDGETIFVHGDYDVDGICAAALFTRFLRGVGGQVVPFVPHRLKHGYDFAQGGLQAAVEAGASLVVTADCGTATGAAAAPLLIRSSCSFSACAALP